VQLHHVLAAVDSTEVTEEREDDGLVAPQRTELDYATGLVEDRHLREIIDAGHKAS
jgi:hypothetical protein